jgi:lipopolysaccharide export system permease LptF/LptG-like protein
MKRPGLGLRAFAARVCNTRAMERWIDPLIADLQWEHAEMVRRGSLWQARWLRLVSLVSFARVLVVAGVDGVCHVFDWMPAAAARRTAIVFVVATVVPTAYLVYAQQSATAVLNPHASRVALTIYLTPSVLPLTVAIGATFAIICGLGDARLTRTEIAAVLTGASVCSILMFANMALVVPDSNQAFREEVFGRPLARGDRELRLGELREQISLRPDEGRRFSVTYHMKSSLAAASIVLTALVLRLPRPWRRSRNRQVVNATIICVCYYLLLISAEQAGIWTMWPVALVAWSPNIACALLTIALAFSTPVSSHLSS